MAKSQTVQLKKNGLTVLSVSENVDERIIIAATDNTTDTGAGRKPSKTMRLVVDAVDGDTFNLAYVTSGSLKTPHGGELKIRGTIKRITPKA